MRRRQGIITTGMLGILVLLLILCPGVAESHAVSTSEARSSETSSVSISLSSSLDLEVLPSGSGTTSRESVELNITTANTSGFHVLVNSSKTTDLVNNHHDEVISTISSPTALSSLPLNTWGIYLGATSPNSSSTFSPLATTPTELVHNELANASGTYKLTIGAKVDTSLPAGLYSNELVISVVADPVKVFSGITYMQDMTSDICSNAEENDTMQLIDKRDGKKYWVAKLKDGNCWMVQNLDLELGVDSDGNAIAIGKDGNTAMLTNENTDLLVDTWNANDNNRHAPSATIKVIPDASYFKSYYGTFSVDAGDIILNNPTESKNCISGNYVTLGVDQEVSTLSAVCSQYYRTITEDMNDNFDATFTTSVSGDEKSYDAHYLIGNWYTYTAAIAGTTAAKNNIAEESICSKGWYLPSNAEQRTMLDTYGVSVDTVAALKTLTTKPLYAVRSGLIYGSSLYAAGERGYYWSSSISDSQNALNYYFKGAAIWRTDYAARSNGFSVRCVAR